LTSALDGDEWSASHSATLPSEKEALAPTDKEDGWAPQLVQILEKRRISCPSAQSQMTPWSTDLQPNHYSVIFQTSFPHTALSQTKHSCITAGTANINITQLVLFYFNSTVLHKCLLFI